MSQETEVIVTFVDKKGNEIFDFYSKFPVVFMKDDLIEIDSLVDEKYLDLWNKDLEISGLFKVTDVRQKFEKRYTSSVHSFHYIVVTVKKLTD